MSGEKPVSGPKSWINEATKAEADASKSGAKGEGMGLHAVLQTLEDLDSSGVEIKPVVPVPEEGKMPTILQTNEKSNDPKYKAHRTIDEPVIGHGFWEGDDDLGDTVDDFEKALKPKN